MNWRENLPTPMRQIRKRDNTCYEPVTASSAGALRRLSRPARDEPGAGDKE